MAPPIVFPNSTSPGKDNVEGAGRLINAYAEPLQEGGPGSHVIRRVPGLRKFAETTQETFRGLWFDGVDTLYGAFGENLLRFNVSGSPTTIAALSAPTLSFKGYFRDGTAQSTYTFPSVPFGAAEASRRIVVDVPATEWAGSELVSNGTFNSNLTGWGMSWPGSWVWNAGSGNGMAQTAGAELVTNGTFASSLSGWTNDGGWYWSTGHAEQSTPSTAALRQTVATVSGASYRVRFDILAAGKTLTVTLGSTTLGIFSTSQVLTVTAPSTNAELKFTPSSGGTLLALDNVSVSRIDPGALTQTITTVNGATYRIQVTGRGGSGTYTVRFGGTVLGTGNFASGTTTFHHTVSGTSNVLDIRPSANIPAGGGQGIDTVTVKRIQAALPTAVTIGGVSATQVVAAARSALWIANVASGSSGNVVLTFAQTMPETAIGVWQIRGLSSDTPFQTKNSTANPPAINLSVPAKGVAIIGMQRLSNTTLPAFSGVSQNFHETIDTTFGRSRGTGYSGYFASASAVIASGGGEASVAAASWGPSTVTAGHVTFAKNNKTPTPDQVLVLDGPGAFTFTASAVTPLALADSAVPNSVCFGEGYFFFTIADGRCYASGINATTTSSLDVIRAEAKPETLVRGVFFDGELYLFGETHTEVWASGGNPNLTGFPFNRTTVIWRGLVGPMAICGFDEGFQNTLIWVADDNTVRQLVGYEPQVISPPDLERDIQNSGDKAGIRCAVFQSEGHPCVAIDVGGDTTWVYDLSTRWWHERQSHDHGHWVWTGNSVKAFGQWIGGHHHNGNLYAIDPAVMSEDGEELPFIAESIAMESFPQRLAINRADFNFVAGVGTPTDPDPEVQISWSDDGGHTWSNPVIRKLGEAGKGKTQVRVNRLGLTGVKGRRFRLRVDDQVYVGLIGGSLEVTGRP